MADDYATPRSSDPGNRIPVTRDTALPAAIRRVSWGAIFAGAFIALVTQLALNLLGLAIGLGTIDPATEQNPLSGLGTGAGIWLALSTIIALLAGGFVAARMAGLPRKKDGVLHGLVAWALVTFLSIYLVSSGVGAVVNSAFNVVQQGTQLLGQGVAAVAPEAAQAVRNRLGDVSLQQVKEEALTILQQTGQEELQPENLAARARQAASTAEAAATDAARTPADAEQEIRSALDRLIALGRDVVTEADRQAVVNVLIARTDMTEAEARQAVAQYESTFQQAQQQISQAAQNVGQRAVQATDQVVATLSKAALWGFIAMLVGAVAAAAGGAAGVPRDMPASPAVRRE